MPATRSATRATITTTTIAAAKRKATDPVAPTKAKRARVIKTTAITSTGPQPLPVLLDQQEPEALVPAKLSFSFEDAKAHLIKADSRFKHLFEKLECKPYEELEMVHPFRALTSSILGQQISWLAARSINHKFIRLFNPDIPQNHADYTDSGFYPTPDQVAQLDLATLRTAGLSQRKAEYVHDLAMRFADQSLSTPKLLAADDEQLAQMLIEVRGIGRWTVDMFAIFSLRRPDILPVGDLGVQRGLVRWFLALHSPSYNIAISPKKESRKPKSEAPKTPVANTGTVSLPVVPTTPVKNKKKDVEIDNGPIPPPFTPSIKTALKKSTADASPTPPLPAGLSVPVLKSRLEGKKKAKGAFLTPNEMEELTESWKPYRSLGVYYMWALAEADIGDD